MSATKDQFEDELARWGEENAAIEEEQLRMHGPQLPQDWMDNHTMNGTNPYDATPWKTRAIFLDLSGYNPPRHIAGIDPAQESPTPLIYCPVCGQPHE